MKTVATIAKYAISFTIVIVVACLVTRACSSTAKAQGQEKRRDKAVVVLWYNPDGYAESPVFYFNGASIYNSSSSAGAPTFPNGSIPPTQALTNLADGLAALINAGFHIVSDEQGRILLVRD